MIAGLLNITDDDVGPKLAKSCFFYVVHLLENHRDKIVLVGQPNLTMATLGCGNNIVLLCIAGGISPSSLIRSFNQVLT
jgi:hypothetical protein